MIQPTEARFYASEILAYTDALNLVYHIHALLHLSLNLWSFGHGHFQSKSLKVLRCNVYNTSLYNKKMGSSLTTHPINPHIYENLYAI